jgi:hypothetical protein
MFYDTFDSMYSSLLIVHSAVRWIALIMLLFSIYRAFIGYRSTCVFSAGDNALRHWTATVFQLQLMIGFVLYFNSPFVSAFWADGNFQLDNTNTFFAIIHLSLMFAAVTVLSIGSALAKRKPDDEQKYKTMLLWFCAGLAIILVAIPWPFSPFAQRPYFRI